MKIIVAILFALISSSSFAQDYKLEGSEVKINKTIVFETGTAKLKPESDEALAIIKKYLDDKSYISLLRVEGHSDNTGKAEENQKLTEQRAMSVCAALVKLGVDCNRLLAVGFGGNKPVADNSTPGGRAENRRISFINVSLKGRVIGGLPVDGGGNIAGDICKNSLN